MPISYAASHSTFHTSKIHIVNFIYPHHHLPSLLCLPFPTLTSIHPPLHRSAGRSTMKIEYLPTYQPTLTSRTASASASAESSHPTAPGPSPSCRISPWLDAPALWPLLTMGLGNILRWLNYRGRTYPPLQSQNRNSDSDHRVATSCVFGTVT